MGVKSFEELKVWQKSQDIAVSVYESMNKTADKPFQQQITRSAVSISNNIAEGFERRTKADINRFFTIARGSNAELRSMLYLALRLNYLKEDDVKKLISETIEISKMLYKFQKTLNSSNSSSIAQRSN